MPVLVALAVGTVWLRLKIVGTTYQINQAEKQIRKLSHERDLAELKLAAQRSPRKLETLARTKFGLQPPRSDQMVHLK